MLIRFVVSLVIVRFALAGALGCAITHGKHIDDLESLLTPITRG